MRFTSICFLLFFSTFCIYGQKRTQIDSMKILLTQQIGIEKVKTLNELSWQLRKQKDSVPIYFALEALATVGAMSW